MDVQPKADQLNVSISDTISIFAHTVKEDPIRSDETSYNLVGLNNDPIFGKNAASFYTQLRLSILEPDFGLYPITDSIVFSMVYDTIYGDSNAQHTFKIYELNEDMYRDSIYFSNKEFLTKSTPVGTKTFIPNYKDSVIVDGDTINKSPALLRIHLNKSLGDKFLSNSSKMETNEDFCKFFKGFYVTSSSATGEGSIMSFKLVDIQSKVTLYYHNMTDTSKYTFYINDYAARVNHFNHTKYQFANPFLKSQIFGDTAKGQKVLYLQSMAGLKVHFSLPYLKDFVKEGKIAINKADLVLSVDDSTDQSLGKYSPPPQLMLVEERDGEMYVLVDQLEGEGYYGGKYNKKTKEYKFNIARHIQQILDGVKENRTLTIVVYTSHRTNIANRVVLKGPGRSDGLKLHITYTKLY